MPFCQNCGKEVLENDRFCLNCGRSLQGATSSAPPNQPSPLPPSAPSSREKRGRSAWGAALLNFFIPGSGYVYVGAGRDSRMVIFGFLLILALAVTFYAGVIGTFVSPAASGSSEPLWVSEISILYLIVPFALAYDGFHRARGAS